MNLSSVDLNLLVAFDILIREQNLSYAAEKLELTQPAMSKRLARLRSLFGDELLTRTSKGMKPTARALELVEPIRIALKQIQVTIDGCSEFKPELSLRTFRVATTDLVVITLIPKLMQLIKKRSPNTRLIIQNINRRHLVKALETGETDLAITALPDAPPHIQRQNLFTERYVCLVSKKHPTIQTKLTLEDYLESSHILVTYTVDLHGKVDRVLEAKGLKRKVVLSLPYHLAVSFIVKETNLITTIAERIALASESKALRIFPLPLDNIEYQEQILWHCRDDSDPAHLWLRELIIEVSREIQI
ncbi:MAG: LysR family transcriptional regulator [Cyanobacteria bacterium P01_E01_bin.35]